jgi:hypothetical protein
MTKPVPDSPPWPTWRWLVLLMVLTAGMRAWQFTHTEVISRDTLSYIRMAWQLEHGNVRQVLRHAPYHPGYPASILLTYQVVWPLAGDDLAVALQRSAQLAAAMASVLLVVPMFFLGLELFDRRLSFWATLLFQCLPSSGRVLGDGLSEALFLLLAACSLLAAVRAMRTGSLLGFALAGLTGGLAYLTRPEGGLIVAAAGLVLLVMQATRTRRSSWGQFLARLVSLGVPALAVAAPYMLTIGHLSTKQAITSVVQAPVQPLTLSDLPLAVWWTGDDPGRAGRALWSLRVLVEIIARTFFYVLWVPALIGLFADRQRIRQTPGVWVLLLVCGVLVVALYQNTVRLGYLSDRHLLLMLLCLSYWTAAGVSQMGGWLARLIVRPWLTPAVGALVLLVPLTVIPAGKSLQTLHGDRLGFRAAGHWLAQNTRPDEAVVDPFGWAVYYAGRTFQEPITALPHYVVLEETGNKHPHLPGYRQALDLIAKGHGQVVWSGAIPHGKIVIYEVGRSL